MLHCTRPGDAEYVLDAWLLRNGKFTDVADIIETAEKMGYNGLAEKWKRL